MKLSFMSKWICIGLNEKLGSKMLPLTTDMWFLYKSFSQEFRVEISFQKKNSNTVTD